MIDDEIIALLRDRLSRLKNYETTEMSLEAYKKYVELYKRGLLVLLPCKLGETVWVCQGGEVVGKTIGRITLNYYHDSNVEIDLCCDGDYPQRVVWHRDLNRYFWLTREEAEKALEAMKNAD